jgi:hypothetical protein
MGHPARLTSHLLAREGTAFPADGFAAANAAFATPAAFAEAAPAKQSMREPGELPAAPPLRAPMPREVGASESRVKMTVRLDPNQHGRLRILAALQRCTSQEIIVRALDAYIRASGDDCACLGRAGSPARKD